MPLCNFNCYRHIEDVHEEFICRKKNIFDKFTAFYNHICLQDQEFVMRPGPTLAGDVQQQQQVEEEEEESLHLHLSASHPSQGSCLQQVISFLYLMLSL